MRLIISTTTGEIIATLDEELEEIQTETPICENSTRVEIKDLSEVFYVTTLADLLKKFGQIEIKNY
jgi:hypothetical protein